MKYTSCFSILIAVAMCASVKGDEVKLSSKPADKEPSASASEAEPPKLSPTQILCIKQRRTGSRMQQTKCQTVAKWQQEIYERDMRRGMIRAQGKAAAWEIAP